jgi:hypothetical protein
MSPEKYTLTKCDIARETDAAIMVRYDGREVWIPLSQVHSMMKNIRPGNSSVTMAAWIARKHGFID